MGAFNTALAAREAARERGGDEQSVLQEQSDESDM